MKVRTLITALEAFAAEVGDDTEVLACPPHMSWHPIEWVAFIDGPGSGGVIGIALDYPR